MESFDVEFYQTPDNAGGNHKMAFTLLFGTHHLILEVAISLREVQL
jgi:hypothetical protein